MGATAIEWTDETWNPVVGCEAISPGCTRCYAARDAAGRLSRTAAYAGLATREPGEPAKFTGEVRCLPERLDQPLRWTRPRMVFVNSMSDLFHPDVPSDFIAQVFGIMQAAHCHSFQVLTKRPQRMEKLLGDGEWWDDVDDHTGWWSHYTQGDDQPLRNVWLGTSIESDRYAFRADHLRSTPAAVRFLSLEPLLGPLPSLDLTDIDWVIVGGESGPGARPMEGAWAREIRDRCVEAGVPFFFKQWGEFRPDGHHAVMERVGKKVAGRHLDGRTWDEMP